MTGARLRFFGEVHDRDDRSAGCREPPALRCLIAPGIRSGWPRDGRPSAGQPPAGGLGSTPRSGPACPHHPLLFRFFPPPATRHPPPLRRRARLDANKRPSHHPLLFRFFPPPATRHPPPLRRRARLDAKKRPSNHLLPFRFFPPPATRHPPPLSRPCRPGKAGRCNRPRADTRASSCSRCSIQALLSSGTFAGKSAPRTQRVRQ